MQVTIDNQVYDLDMVAKSHPGGESIRVWDGKDATAAYRSMHPKHPCRHPSLKRARLGRADVSSRHPNFTSPFATELKRAVAQAVPDPWAGGVSMASIQLICILCAVGFYVKFPSVWSSVTFGLVLAFGGLLGLQHAGNHGAVSRRVWVNEACAAVIYLAGGSRYGWTRQHQVAHHAHTNGSLDADYTSSEPVAMLRPTGNRSRWHRYQWIYLHLLAPFYGLGKLVTEWNGVGYDWYTSCSNVVFRLLGLSVIGSSASVSYWYPLIVVMVTSVVLVETFILSHNFNGVRAAEENTCWYAGQVESSCTYGGRISGWLTGGLNYQIEHHLFPKMNPIHYPTIQPVVQDLCAKYGVRYTVFASFGHNFIDTWRFVARRGLHSS
jgi:fatty acid desaturase (delta-4 desaturase)